MSDLSKLSDKKLLELKNTFIDGKIRLYVEEQAAYTKEDIDKEIVSRWCKIRTEENTLPKIGMKVYYVDTNCQTIEKGKIVSISYDERNTVTKALSSIGIEFEDADGRKDFDEFYGSSWNVTVVKTLRRAQEILRLGY